MTTSNALCCFCGEDIAAIETDPLWLTASTAKEETQTWFCHTACFKSRLTDPPGAEGLFEPIHF